MGVFESLRSFEAAMPRMCLFCRAGWLVFPTKMEGRVPSVLCAWHGWTAHPRRSGGVDLPKADYMPLMEAGEGSSCEHFAPVRIGDLKASLLDLMGFFDEMEDTPLPLGGAIERKKR